MSNPKILIVDDDEGMRSQLKWGLNEYEVITASSREHALEQFKLHRPPLVTLDLGMPPDIDGVSEGVAILEAILLTAPKTKVVVVSGVDELNNAQMVKNNGAYEFYSKPVELEKLHQIIKRAYADYQASELK